MTSRRCRGNHRVDAPLYIKQREPAGAQKKNSCQFILTVPLFNVGEETTACFLSQIYRVETSCPLVGGRRDAHSWHSRLVPLARQRPVKEPGSPRAGNP